MNTNDYTIRLERTEDYRDVENLVRESFWNVYRPGCSEHYVIHVLRDDPAFVKELDFVMEQNGKLIGQICHAGWVLASAEILEGRKVTSTPGIRDDLRHAGAVWLDEPCVVDGNLVSARRPPDIPEYEKQLVKFLFGE